MRIAYICADRGIPVFGRKGCSIHVQEVIRALVRRGIRVDLFSPRTEGEPPAGFDTVEVHPLPVPLHGDVATREQGSLAANRYLGEALEQAGPFDLVYERYSLWSFAGMEYAQKHATRGLLEVNAPLIQEQALHRILLDRPAVERIAHKVFGAATVLLAVSDEVARYLASVTGPAARVEVVPNGVDPARFRTGVPAAYPAAPGAFTVGFVGSLKPWHGLTVLVEAFARLHGQAPESRLLVVGDGPARGALEEALADRGLQTVTTLTGSVSAEAVPGFLAAMDVAVAPYDAASGFYFSPLKVFEYMSAGLPTVASAVGQLCHVIEDGTHGLLVPPGDAEALAEALERLRANPELRWQLGAAARERVQCNYTWDGVVHTILRLGGLLPELSFHGPKECRTMVQK